MMFFTPFLRRAKRGQLHIFLSWYASFVVTFDRETYVEVEKGRWKERPLESDP